MTEAPDKIWAWAYRDPDSDEPSTHGEWYTEDVGLDGDETEYTRTALIPALLAEARAEGRREALREAAKVLLDAVDPKDLGGGYPLDQYGRNWFAAALRALAGDAP